MSQSVRVAGVLVVIAVASCGGSVEPEHHGATSQALTSRVLSTCDANHQQDDAAISGTRVLWTEVTPFNVTFPGGSTGSGTSADVIVYDLTTSTATDLNNTQVDSEFLQQVSGDNAVWTHVAPGISGDIVAWDFVRQRASTIASSTETMHFEQPAIEGNVVTFLRVTGTTMDVYLYDLFSGPVGLATDGTGFNTLPQTDGTLIVWTHYANATDVSTDSGTIWARPVVAVQQSWGTTHDFGGPAFPITTTPMVDAAADVDGGVVVYMGDAGGTPQLFIYDMASGRTTQLTTTPGEKLRPRISGGRVVWSDSRSGDYDLYGYDIATKTEVPLATGAGNQFIPEIDGDQVVYTNDASGCEHIELLTFPVITPPPSVASIQNDVTGLFGSGAIKNAGIENALLSKLAAAAALRAAGDCAGAAAIYQAFINSIEAQRNKGITDAAATTLIADAQYLIAHCP